MKDYHINVSYSDEDEGYIADIPDLRHCSAFGATVELAGGGRRADVTRARSGIAYLWVRKLGQSGRRLAPVLGIAPQCVYQELGGVILLLTAHELDPD